MKIRLLTFLSVILVSCSPPYESIKQQLNDIYSSDQNDRLKSEVVGQKIDSLRKIINQPLSIITKQDSDNLKNAETEMAFLWSKIDKQDAANLIKVKEIIGKYGWLGADVIGEQANTTLFLVIQHSDLKIQEKYLPIMKEAVKNKKASALDLALLIDRIEVGNGRPQIYGSQISEKDGIYTIDPIADEINVNKRRAEVGLEPLDEYVKHWGIKYKLPTK